MAWLYTRVCNLLRNLPLPQITTGTEKWVQQSHRNQGQYTKFNYISIFTSKQLERENKSNLFIISQKKHEELKNKFMKRYVKLYSENCYRLQKDVK